jgi:hypothetical protein
VPEGDGAGAEDGQTPLHQSSPDESPTRGAAPSTRSCGEQVIDAPAELSDPEVVQDSGLQCGTCVNMGPNGWCHQRRFFVTATLPACDVYYEPMPADRSGQ